ncbi:MAG: FomA family porin-like outer membrane protein [Fusobacteriaceae bacterium]
MKRLAMILGSILVVSAVASAKEVVAYPVIIEEPAAVEEIVVELPVLEKEPEFKSTGWVRLLNKYYANGEHKSVTGNYSRTELSGYLSLTEKDNLYFRNRIYDNLNSVKSDQKAPKDRIRAEFRWWHDFGKLLDSKIGVKTQLGYEQRAYKDGEKDFRRVRSFLELEFTEYLSWSPEWFKNKSFMLSPNFVYFQYDKADSKNYTHFGTEIITSWGLPLDFIFDLNAYYYYDTYGNVAEFEVGYGKANDFSLEFYLSNSWALLKSTDEKSKLSFEFIGGLDDYGHYEYDNKEGKRQDYYEFFSEVQLKIDHKVNNSLGVFVYAGAEYRNFNNSAVSSAQGWTWRPMAGAGFKASF